jgi:hypothetical protein
MSTPDPTSTPSEGTRQAECPYVTGTVTRYCTLTPLSLTDAEREAVERAAGAMAKAAESRGEIQAAWYLVDDADTLRGLLERTDRR